ncbi:MAG: bifunctional diaminohydroxyphosphoribosylaminopyrimidine deaminase/5-amino-6-(5-phosphoribosylamino)uracil reductase RibD [Solirubrobacteraceae bacterium]|nr:bifunctional diaminohydroxyphosphoribosylaminopyrimidine deaminase/5-amino-6-(5-phosphoribosylamino)uracil reductase RibD [Solirubrobacteraceae bacterium]
MAIDATDRTHLARAVELALRGQGSVHPNPMVGCVIIAPDGTLVAEGWHARYGGPHAEAAALAEAGEAARGATAYVSLEPCAHTGKTGPCSVALAQAGVTRVVVASDDPSEKASGRGLGYLRDENVTVEVLPSDDPIARDARLLNQPFRKHSKTGLPWVLHKAASTLDGKIASRTGDSKWVTSEVSRERGHRWRANLDAVVVGIGTALADDPQLTARIPGVVQQPRRIVFDTEARLPLDSKLMQEAPEIPLTVVVSRAAPRGAVGALTSSGAEVIVATGEHEQARVLSALDQIGQSGVTSILLEGGPHLAGSFYDAGAIDELRLFLAPKILGGRNARGIVEGVGIEQVADALLPVDWKWEPSGDDLLITARLREW